MTKKEISKHKNPSTLGADIHHSPADGSPKLTYYQLYFHYNENESDFYRFVSNIRYAGIDDDEEKNEMT